MNEKPPRSCLEPRLVFATGNAHKIGELEAILAPAQQGYAPGTITRIPDFDAPAPLKDGTTFKENSLIEARALVEFMDLPTLADDSRVCTDIMDRAPGISSMC